MFKDSALNDSTFRDSTFRDLSLNVCTIDLSQRGFLLYDKKAFIVANRPKVLLLGLDFLQRAKTEPNFETVLVPLLFPYKFIDFSQILSLKWF